MRIEDVLERVKGKITARKQKISDGVMLGQQPDFASVRYQTGIHKGLVEAEDLIREVLKELHGEDDDES